MGKYFIGYVTMSGMSEITESQAKKLTHLNIAFAPVTKELITSIEGQAQHMHHIKRIKEYNKNLNILISTGGGDNKGHGEATKTPEGLQKIVMSTIDIVEEYDLDGIDCDWEFPGDTGIIEEKYQHTTLFKKYRDELDVLEKKNNKKYWLTTAAGAGKWFVERTEIDVSHKYMDFINLMTYDLRGWTEYAGHHTSLYEPSDAPITHSCDTDIKLLTDANVPIEKIAIGVAFYSHRWDNLENINNGLNQKAPQVSTFGPDYTGISLIFEDHMGYVKYWDDVACAPYLFNGSSLISYDDPMSIKLKCEYVHKNNMAGAFYWVHSADKTGKLFQSMYDGLYL